MQGWKTKLGGVLAILFGVCGYGITFFGYPGITWEVAWPVISGGFVALGLGHKADKLLDAMKLLAKVQGVKALLPLLLGLSLLSACATTQGGTGTDAVGPDRLHQFTKTDIQAALDMATVQNDEAAIQCYTYWLELLDKPEPTVPQVKGAISAFQATRGVLENGPGKVQSFLDEFNLHCAALFNSAAATLVKIGLIGAGKAVTGGLAP